MGSGIFSADGIANFEAQHMLMKMVIPAAISASIEEQRRGPDRPRYLSATLYDSIKGSAELHKGIGGGQWNDASGVPLCVHGHIMNLTGARIDGDGVAQSPTPLYRQWTHELRNQGIEVGLNDWAVMAYNVAHGRPQAQRLTFEEWCEQLHVLRAREKTIVPAAAHPRGYSKGAAAIHAHMDVMEDQAALAEKARIDAIIEEVIAPSPYALLESGT